MGYRFIPPELSFPLLAAGALYLCYRAGVFLVREVPRIEMRGARILVAMAVCVGMLLLLGFAGGLLYLVRDMIEYE